MRYQQKAIFCLPFTTAHERFLSRCRFSRFLRRCKSKCWKSKESEMNWQFAYISVFFLLTKHSSEVIQKENALQVIFYESIKAVKASVGSHWNSVKSEASFTLLSGLDLHYIDNQQPSNSWNDFKVTSTKSLPTKYLNLNFTKLSCL